MRGSGDPPSGRRLPNSGSLIERAVLFRPFVLPGICCRSLRWSTGPCWGLEKTEKTLRRWDTLTRSREVALARSLVSFVTASLISAQAVAAPRENVC